MLHNDIQLWKNIQQKYGNLVNYIMKNNRGVIHKNTDKKAMSLICMKDIGNSQTYIDFYNEVYSRSTVNRSYPVTYIQSFIRKRKLSYPAFQKCMRNPGTFQKLQNETLEAQKYNLSGTPGVIVLNTKTKKYVIVEGAYPIETFYNAVDELLK